MDLLEIVMIIFQITIVHTKKKYLPSSDESIENLLYYRDCQHKNNKEETTATPVVLRAPDIQRTREPDCPFPRMCCALSCGNECNSQQSFMGRMEPQPNMAVQPMTAPRQPQLPIQPQIVQRGRKKKMKPQLNMQPPIGGRRNFGFTKEKIKSLISQDGDIRKILKDLVRVTMQKVDLMTLTNTKTNMNQKADVSNYSDEEE